VEIFRKPVDPFSEECFKVHKMKWVGWQRTQITLNYSDWAVNIVNMGQVCFDESIAQQAPAVSLVTTVTVTTSQFSAASTWHEARIQDAWLLIKPWCCPHHPRVWHSPN
jgi:hypothetical protein